MDVIQDLIDYIEDNLSEALSIDKVAAHAGYARHHFQRLFSAATGTTLGGYITHRRLTLAACKLVQTKTRIIEIALEAGYGSQEAFSRAFKEMYSFTPAQFRQRGLMPALRHFADYRDGLYAHVQAHPELATPRRCRRESLTLLGLEGTARRQEIGALATTLWTDLARRINEIPQLTQKKERAGYGVVSSADEQDSVDQRLTYMAAIEAPQEATPPQGMIRRTLEAQDYLVFTHRGPMETLALTNRYIWGIWLTQNKIKVPAAPDFEYYASLEAPINGCAVWIPV